MRSAGAVRGRCRGGHGLLVAAAGAASAALAGIAARGKSRHPGIGVGTPRGLQGRVVSAVWALIRRLVGLWGGLERVLAPFLPDLPSTASLPRCQAFQPSI